MGRRAMGQGNVVGKTAAGIAMLAPSFFDGIAMDLGILETGSPPADLNNRFGSYGDMFRQM